MDYQRPYLYPKQEAAIFCPERFSIIEASTKSGKTVGSIAWLVEEALKGKPGHNYWWGAPVFPQADIAYRRIKQFLTPGSFTPYATPQPRIELINGATIWIKSADNPDSLYGEDVYAAVGDEITRWKEEAWHALRSTLTATKGACRLIGNVKDRKNFAFTLARKAEKGELPGWHYAKITWRDAVASGVLDPEDIEDARRTLPENIFRALYEAEADDDGGNPFGLNHIEACISFLSERPVVAWGIDLAKKQDYLVLTGLDDQRNVAAFFRWRGIPWRESIKRIHRIVGEDTPTLVDSTGVGDPVLEELQYEHGNFFGYNFSSASKQKLMEGLAVSIQGHEIGFPDGVIRQELDSFQYEYTRTGFRYCLDPETPVLTSNLTWTSVGSLCKGDSLVGFDEEPYDGRKVRQWGTAEVTDTGYVQRPCYRILLKDGTSFVCSAEHKWLTANMAGPIRWIETSKLRGHNLTNSLRFTPHKLIKVCSMWATAATYEAGYLAGVFDGEGSLHQATRNDHEGSISRLSFAQRNNSLAFWAREYMTQMGFQWAETGGSGTNKDVITFSLKGRTSELLRFLGTIRPKRLLKKFDPNLLGAMWTDDTVEIEAIEYLGERAVIALGTSTGTFIARGFATHNSAPEGENDDCVCSLALARQMHCEAIPGANVIGYMQDVGNRTLLRPDRLEASGAGLVEAGLVPHYAEARLIPKPGELTDVDVGNPLLDFAYSFISNEVPVCKFCHLPVKTLTVITDGENIWHPECGSVNTLRAAA